MKTIQLYERKVNSETIPEKISVCLGYFDGIHLGHKKLVEFANEHHQFPLALLTFDQPASSLLDNYKAKEVLTSLNDRFRLLSRLYVDYYLVQHIDREFLDMSASQFIDYLKELKVKEVFVGEDYRFGKNAAGTIDMLKKSFDVHVVDTYTYNGEKVSTQKIISLLKEGNVPLANKLLGHNYLMNGIVTEGHHNGEKFGIRTANVKLSTNYVIPKLGVYKVIAYIEGMPHLAIANVGVHPTIDKEDFPILEVHIPDYDSVDYEKNINVEFLEFMRDEKVFSNTEELIAQIKKDIARLG